jgi:hypothetical protein
MLCWMYLDVMSFIFNVFIYSFLIDYYFQDFCLISSKTLGEGQFNLDSMLFYITLEFQDYEELYECFFFRVLTQNFSGNSNLSETIYSTFDLTTYCIFAQYYTAKLFVMSKKIKWNSLYIAKNQSSKNN